MNYAALIETIALFTVIIVIHELGHLLVAKFFKFKVSEFCIGMGKLLYSKKFGDTDYQLRLFPIGGHIRIECKLVEMSSKDIIKWMVGVMAGPIFNIISGLLFYKISPRFMVLSLYTGLINLVPFPPQDGFMLVAGIYQFCKKRKEEKK